MNNDKKKILIVGASGAAYSLAKHLSEKDNVETVFVAAGTALMKDFAQCVDIREDSCAELLDFAMENSIDLTIVCSLAALNADIVSFFNANSQMIFAPSQMSSQMALSRAFAKKFLYKQRIQTPKFGVFEKQQLALDYLKNANYPLLISTDEERETQDQLVCTNLSLATTFIEELYMRGEKKVVIEEYVYGHRFTFYTITDGYQVLPLVSVADYKFAADGDGGLFSKGSGAFAPDYKVSSDLERRLLKDVAGRVVSSLEHNGNPYVGILGIEVVLKDDEHYVVTGFKSFLQDYDTAVVLDVLGDDILGLMEACVIGSFADDYEFINLNGKSAVSCVISASAGAEKVVEGINSLDEDSQVSFINAKTNNYMEYLAASGRVLTLTRNASTLSRARNLLYEDVDTITFLGKKYRSDICPSVN